jgi:thymidylate kinase
MRAPLFGSPVPELSTETRRLWIELEGVGGCGKTSQAELLVPELRKLFPSRRVIRVAEFSHSALGNLIRENLRQLRFELPAGPGAYEILYALADAVEKGWETILATEWDIALVDRYRWSIAAHMIALAPAALHASDRSALVETSERIAALLPLPGARLLTMYLRCVPEVAVHRAGLRTSAPLDAQEARFIQQLHEGYEQLSSRHPEFHQIDANASTDEVSQALIDLISVHASALSVAAWQSQP